MHISGRDAFEIVECTAGTWDANILRLSPRSVRCSKKSAFDASASETNAAVTSEHGHENRRRKTENTIAYWHSPHDTVNGETTLSPTLRVAYRSGRPVTPGWKFAPRAITSPVNSCPQTKLEYVIFVIKP
jgi:hypothetical protein